MSSVRQTMAYLRKVDDDFWAGGRLARAAGVTGAIVAAVFVGGLIGLFASVPLLGLIATDRSDYGTVLYPFYAAAMGAGLGGFGMATYFVRRRRR